MKDTSIDAYYASRKNAERMKPRIYAVMQKENHPLTTTEIAKIGGLEYAQVHKRMSELEKDGHVQCTCEKGINPSGRHAYKWQITPPQQT